MLQWRLTYFLRNMNDEIPTWIERAQNPTAFGFHSWDQLSASKAEGWWRWGEDLIGTLFGGSFQDLSPVCGSCFWPRHRCYGSSSQWYSGGNHLPTLSSCLTILSKPLCLSTFCTVVNMAAIISLTFFIFFFSQLRTDIQVYQVSRYLSDKILPKQKYLL